MIGLGGQVCTMDDIAEQNASGGEKIHMSQAAEIAMEVHV
jgi:hypothetical protein